MTGLRVCKKREESSEVLRVLNTPIPIRGLLPIKAPYILKDGRKKRNERVKEGISQQ
jgi:hypothetical protein